MKTEKSSFALRVGIILLAGILVLFALTGEGITAAPTDSETLSEPLSDTADILSDSLTLLTPNGGEIVASGSLYTISWAAPSSAARFKLKYSIDNGLTWYLMANDVPGTSYNWDVPALSNNKKQCLIKIIGFAETGGRVGADTSDSTFTIEVVRVTSPNGGETLTSGATHDITWTVNNTVAPVRSVDLFYTKNAGVTWKEIYGTYFIGDNSGKATWTLPNVLSSKTQCKVKVVLRDSEGIKIGSDASNGYFTISPASSTTYTLTVTKAGTGSGNVTATPGTINWSGNTGTASYASGTTVTLTAAAISGNFVGWSGACSGTAATCQVTMNQARNVTATFNIIH